MDLLPARVDSTVRLEPSVAPSSRVDIRTLVAVTRAQALLIVVGDPTVLSLDPLWRSFLNYIYINQGWTGSPITWDPTIPVDEAGGYDKQIRDSAASDLSKIQELRLANVEDGDGNVDRPWKLD